MDERICGDKTLLRAHNRQYCGYNFRVRNRVFIPVVHKSNLSVYVRTYTRSDIIRSYRFAFSVFRQESRERFRRFIIICSLKQRKLIFENKSPIKYYAIILAS